MKWYGHSKESSFECLHYVLPRWNAINKKVVAKKFWGFWDFGVSWSKIFLFWKFIGRVSFYCITVSFSFCNKSFLKKFRLFCTILIFWQLIRCIFFLGENKALKKLSTCILCSKYYKIFYIQSTYDSIRRIKLIFCAKVGQQKLMVEGWDFWFWADCHWCFVRYSINICRCLAY